MKPYYQDDAVTIYHGDCREIVPTLGRFDLMLTDPVWPGNKIKEFAKIKPARLFKETVALIESVRIAVQIGCWVDPAFLSAIRLPFFRICWLPYSLPGHYGRLLNTGDVAYLYGTPPKSLPGQRLIPGVCNASKKNFVTNKMHPCPRKYEHVIWLAHHFSREGEIILDPFGGSCTTGRAAKDLGRKCVCIEREERYCEIGAKRMAQEVFDFNGSEK